LSQSGLVTDIDYESKFAWLEVMTNKGKILNDALQSFNKKEANFLSKEIVCRYMYE
jgi:hypothetical protein